MDVTDPLTWVVLASAIVAMVAAILHLYGWLPARYTARLREVQTGLASNIGVEVESALDRVAAKQQAAYAAQAAAASTSVDMSLVRASRSLKDAKVDIDSEMSQAILGPALPILRQFAPGLADRLEEEPQLVGFIIEHPLFKKYVLPRIEQFMGQQQASSEGVPTGWGT